MKTVISTEESEPLILPQMAEVLEEVWELCDNEHDVVNEARPLIEKVMKRYYITYGKKSPRDSTRE